MKTITGNILDIKEGILVHQVNTLGYANRGLALQIRNKWPDWYSEYKKYTHKTQAKLGDTCSYYVQLHPPIVIFSIYGQKEIGYTKQYTNYDALIIGLQDLYRFNESKKWPVYFPYKIGCGLGNGKWSVVLDILEQYYPEGIIIKLEK